MSLVIQEITSILYASAPDLLAQATKFPIFYSAIELSQRCLVIWQRNCFTLKLLFFNDWDGPLSFAVLLAFAKGALKDTAIILYQLSVAFRLAIPIVSNVASSILVDFHACPMLESVFKQAFVNVTQMVLKDAIAPRFVIGPHSREMKL